MTPEPGDLPQEAPPPPSGPELDPSGAPEEMPSPAAPGDDGMGRPMDAA